MPVETALVVDDSKSARIMLSRMVQKVGLEVNMVESGEEAIAYLAANPHPDVIFMDHMMPGMDGLQTTQQITKDPATAHIPVFMYTSKEGEEYEAELLACGATGMLGKPAKPDRLKEIVEQLNEAAEQEGAIEVADTVQGTSETIVSEVVEDTVPAVPDAAETEPTEAEIEEIAKEPAETPAPEYMPPEEEPAEDLLPEVEDAATPAPVEHAEQPEEEEAMSKEMIEEVASPMIARALEDALQPLRDSLNRMESQVTENQSEIRKLNSRQASNVNMVTQPVLDASLKQTTVQLQNQLTNEIKSLRELIESRSELAPEILQKITDLASKAGSDAGMTTAEKSASSAAEAVAAKVGAAQAQVQVQQELKPFAGQAKKANGIAVVALIAAIVAIALPFVL